MDIASTTTTWFAGFATAQSGGKSTSTAFPALTERQMKELIASRDLLKQLPDRKTTERQARLEKIQMLRDRLKLLRKMIAFLSPSSTKTLAAEIKQIASQLAALGDGSGGGLSSGTGGGTSGSAQGGGEHAASPGQTPSPATLSAATGADNGSAGHDTTIPVTPSPASVSVAVPHQVATGGDRQLKEGVEEVRTLLRSVVEALKRKRQQDKAAHPAANGATLTGNAMTSRFGAAGIGRVSLNA